MKTTEPPFVEVTDDPASAMSDPSNSQPAPDGDSVQRFVGQIIRFRVGKSSRRGLCLEVFRDGDLLVSETWAGGNRHRRVKPSARPLTMDSQITQSAASGSLNRLVRPFPKRWNTFTVTSIIELSDGWHVSSTGNDWRGPFETEEEARRNAPEAIWPTAEICRRETAPGQTEDK